MTDQPDLKARVEKRYSPVPVPPCVVCGKPLSIAAAGRGMITYACEAGDSEHYARSRFETHSSDSDVLALLSRITELEAERDEALKARDRLLVDVRAAAASSLTPEGYVIAWDAHGRKSTSKLEPWEQAYQDAGVIHFAWRRGYICIGTDVRCTVTLEDRGEKLLAEIGSRAQAAESRLALASNLLREARLYVTDALDAHEHSDGRELLSRIDAALAAYEEGGGASKLQGNQDDA